MTCHPEPALREKNLLLVAAEGPAATLVPQRSLRPQPKIGFSLPIADCRLTIEKVVWQLLPMSISNRQSKIGNSSHPGPSDDRGKSSPHMKKMKTSAPATSTGRVWSNTPD